MPLSSSRLCRALHFATISRRTVARIQHPVLCLQQQKCEVYCLLTRIANYEVVAREERVCATHLLLCFREQYEARTISRNTRPSMYSHNVVSPSTPDSTSSQILPIMLSFFHYRLVVLMLVCFALFAAQQSRKLWSNRPLRL
jgi:hypothetical protein